MVVVRRGWKPVSGPGGFPGDRLEVPRVAKVVFMGEALVSELPHAAGQRDVDGVLRLVELLFGGTRRTASPNSRSLIVKLCGWVFLLAYYDGELSPCSPSPRREFAAVTFSLFPPGPLRRVPVSARSPPPGSRSRQVPSAGFPFPPGPLRRVPVPARSPPPGSRSRQVPSAGSLFPPGPLRRVPLPRQVPSAGSPSARSLRGPRVG